MPSTVLAIAQRFARLNGLVVPSVLFAGTDADSLQWREIINTVGKDIRRKTNWEKLRIRTTWTSTGVESQGLITAKCTNNCEYIIPDTFWDTTTREPIFGPLTDGQWQAIKALVPSTPLYQYKILEGTILVAGPVPNTDTLSLMYKTFSWLQTAANVTPTLTDMTADTNVPVFPDELMDLGVSAYWKKIKGLAGWDQEMAKFTQAAQDLGGNDSVKPVIDMSGGTPKFTPGIWVPAGSWNV
jgi:hypothetical protein